MVKQKINHHTAVDKAANDMIQNSRFHMTKNFIQHGSISVYAHCFSVAVMSIRIARFLKIKVPRLFPVRLARHQQLRPQTARLHTPLDCPEKCP